MAPSYPMPVLQELLTHQDFVRRLARHLVGDEHRAADVAQEVWVRAMEQPPRQRTSLRGWLARVTRSVASNSARGERRRRLHEGRIEQPDVTIRAASAARELALQQRVVEAVQTLDEPYRSTLLLRYFEGLSRGRIAEELGIPVATVSTRLQRGLAKLRERLDRAHGGDRGAWVRGLVLLLAKDPLPPLLPVGGGVLGGGTTLGTLAKVGVALVLLAGTGWWLRGWFGDESEPSGTEVVANGESRAEETSPANAGAVSHEVGDGSLRSPVPVDAAHDEPSRRPGSSLTAGWAIQGRVHGMTARELRDVRLAATALPAAGGKVLMPPPIDFAGPHGVPIDDEGFFEMDLSEVMRRSVPVELAGFVFVAQHPACTAFTTRILMAPDEWPEEHPTDPMPPVVWWVDVHMAPAALLVGRVVQADDRPPVGGGAVAYRLRDRVPELVESAHTACNAEGFFTLRVPEGGEYAVVGLSGRLVSRTAILQAVVGEERSPAAPLVLAGWETIEGRVLGQQRPHENAKVRARLVGGDAPGYDDGADHRYMDIHELVWTEDGFVPAMRGKVWPEPDGHFAVPGLAAATYLVGLDPPGLAVVVPGTPVGVTREVKAPASGVELVAPWATVRLEASPPLDQKSWGILTATGATGSVVQGFRGDQGIPPLACPPGEGLQVQLRCGGRQAWEGTLVAPDAGEVSTRTIEMPEGGDFAAVEFAVTAVGAPPPAKVTLMLAARREHGGHLLASGIGTVRDGTARFAGLLPGEYDAFLASSVQGTWLVTSAAIQPFSLDLVAGAELRYAVDFRVGGRLTFTVLDEDGVPLPATVELRDDTGQVLDPEFVTFWQGQRPEYTRGALSGGGTASTLDALPVGNYEVRLSAPGYREESLAAEVKAGAITPITVEMQRAAGAAAPREGH